MIFDFLMRKVGCDMTHYIFKFLHKLYLEDVQIQLKSLKGENRWSFYRDKVGRYTGEENDNIMLGYEGVLFKERTNYSRNIYLNVSNDRQIWISRFTIIKEWQKWWEDKHTLVSLQKICKLNKLRGWSKLNKKDIIQFIMRY